VFSAPGGSEADSFITLPSTKNTFTAGKNDTGYIYFEGWAGPTAPNLEFGFIYSKIQNAYTHNNYYGMYISRATDTLLGSNDFAAGDQVFISVIALENSPYLGDCTTNTCAQVAVNDSSGVCQNYNPPPGLSCGGFDSVDAPHWVWDCCIFARMTTIAQKPANNFTDGSKFGPIAWSGAEEGPDPNGITPPWNTGGSQSWPADNTVNIVQYLDMADETDTIYLHP
jgi:hypothetical protein